MSTSILIIRNWFGTGIVKKMVDASIQTDLTMDTAANIIEITVQLPAEEKKENGEYVHKLKRSASHFSSSSSSSSSSKKVKLNWHVFINQKWKTNIDFILFFLNCSQKKSMLYKWSLLNYARIKDLLKRSENTCFTFDLVVHLFLVLNNVCLFVVTSTHNSYCLEFIFQSQQRHLF